MCIGTFSSNENESYERVIKFMLIVMKRSSVRSVSICPKTHLDNEIRYVSKEMHEISFRIKVNSFVSS